jgi:hypothetical protein
MNSEKAGRNSTIAAMCLAVSALLAAPMPVRADDSVRLEGAFTVLYAYPSAVNYCAGGPGDDRASIQAEGIGHVPGLGPLFLTVKKCMTFADGIYLGTFKLTAPNGHALRGTYAGTQGPYDANGFSTFQGALTITGGTGKFRDARGRLTFEASAGPDSLSAISEKLNGTAFYAIRGNVLLSEDR